MTRDGALAVAVMAGAALLALAVALSPVTIGTLDIVPEHLAPLVPESLIETEIECGSVLTPRSSDGGPSIPIIGDRATAACRERLYRKAAIAIGATMVGVTGAVVTGRRRFTSKSRRPRSSTVYP